MTDTPPSPSQPSGPHCDCGDSGICRPGCPRYEQKMAAQPSGPSIEEQIAAVDRARMTRRHQAQFDNGLSYGANLEADALVEALATLRAHEAQSRELAETRAEIERLTSFISSDNLEACAEAAHEAWLAEKRRRGVTSWPNERGFEQMVSYADCSDDIKEFDRVVVKAIIARLRAPSGKDAMEDVFHASCPSCGSPVEFTGPLHRAIGFARAETEARFRPLVEAGWKEATIAWSVCASIHREYGKRRDALYTTRQADFLKHETDARAALAELEEGNK